MNPSNIAMLDNSASNLFKTWRKLRICIRVICFSICVVFGVLDFFEIIAVRVGLVVLAIILFAALEVVLEDKFIFRILDLAETLLDKYEAVIVPTEDKTFIRYIKNRPNISCIEIKLLPTSIIDMNEILKAQSWGVVLVKKQT